MSHKSYVAINVAGLGIAFALCIMAYLNWKFDADFDKFHAKADQLYRVTSIKQNTHQMFGVAPAPLDALAKSNIAGVKEAISVDIWGVSVNAGPETFYETFLFTNPEFFTWFDFNLVQGVNDLSDPGNALITESSALKYFGQKDPVGQTIAIYTEPERQRELVITGVVEDPPQNSSIFFDFITNTANQYYGDGQRYDPSDWARWRDGIFLAIPDPNQKAEVLAQLNSYAPAHTAGRPDFGTKEYFLEPLIGMAGHSDQLRWNGLRDGIPPSSIWGNIVMAVLLLITSCLNFANTTVSLAGKRLKEIGVRKVLGGHQRQLIAQLMLESFWICAIGLLLGVVLSQYLVEWYNQMWQWLDLEMSLVDNPPLIAFLAGTVLVTTLMAGAYPSFYVSSFNPNSIFHGSVKFGGSNLVSRVLLGFQVAISLVAVVVGLSFARNAEFQRTADMGYAREGIQAIYAGSEKAYNVMNNQMASNPKVTGTAGVRFHIGDSCPRYEFDLNGQKHEAEFMEVGPNYLELMDIQVTAGRGFNENLETDFVQSIIINQKLANDLFHSSDPIGQTITFFDTAEYSIIGIAEDFIQDSFFDPIRPMVIKMAKPERFLYLAIRSQESDMLEVKSALESSWKANFPAIPFDHHYQDDFLAESLEVTNSIKVMMMGLAIVTMILTLTGLFALMSLNILKRIKEIAVRRILGASVSHVTYILNKNYIWIILLGIILGCGGGAYLALTLLDSIYGIHAGIALEIMLMAGMLCIVAVAFTMGVKLKEVLNAQPAQVLSSE